MTIGIREVKYKLSKSSQQSAMGRKYEGIKIPIIEKERYFHCKVKMMMYILSLDAIYINYIDKSFHVLLKY